MRKSLIWAIPAIAALATPAAAMDWNGFYAGAVAGYTFGTSDASYDSPDIINPVPIPFSTFGLDSEPSGGSVGVTVGYNSVMDGGAVFGVEGDLSASFVGDTIYDDFADYRGRPGNTIAVDTDYSGTFRGRLGFAADQFMPYLTAGIAFAHTTVTPTDYDVTPISDEATTFGWTAGAGFEVAASDTISVKAEYLYTDLGEHTWFEGELYSSTSHSTSHTIRAGVNFHFD